MQLDPQTKADIEVLKTLFKVKMEKAEKSKSDDFVALGKKFAPMAHRIYLYLDKPLFSIKLPPAIVANRVRCSGFHPEEVEFWEHPDVIEALCDYIIENQNELEGE